MPHRHRGEPASRPRPGGRGAAASRADDRTVREAAVSGSAVVIRGDAAALPLPDASVDLVVTSPPYYALRAYQDGGQTYSGQIGAEPTPDEYIANLVECTREWVRVLKPAGSMWVNLGDKYAATASGPHETLHSNHTVQWRERRAHAVWPVPYKSLIGIPWRYALACIDQLGLILRAEVIWSKPNGLPESVTDRVRRSHEQWFHFVRKPRYYSAVDEIREPLSEWSQQALEGRWTRRTTRSAGAHDGKSDINVAGRNYAEGINPLGKLPGSVWEIASEPLRVPEHLGVDHFAAFPIEWPRRIITGWSPPGICVECGEGRRPVAAVEYEQDAEARRRRLGTISRVEIGAGAAHGNGSAGFGRRTTITGYACDCEQPTAPTRPAVVLDPFGGTGTTALVASVLGRVGISVDRSADYCRLARWRTTDPGERARAARVPKPPEEIDGQISL